MRAAHPRSRGENLCPRPGGQDVRGSSPLTRGKPRNPDGKRNERRLIPAHAGKTLNPNREQAVEAAHPRSRGENPTSSCPSRRNVGSSPLTRGKQQQRGRDNLDARLIPAHAGKTPSPRQRRARPGAHPRSRGENLAWAVEGAREYGSSPLTRGKLRGGVERLRLRGLIPAHAGKTPAYQYCPANHPAHPRSRGENIEAFVSVPASAGSSPLTRGKQGGQVMDTTALRLIPAHAGKTVVRVVIRSLRWAHPRSRGENELIGISDQFNQGSSPLTRGKRESFSGVLFCEGLIPAHAGKTPESQRRTWGGAAHPRSRGENFPRQNTGLGQLGSSPLTRGKPRVGCRRRARVRLIPAHAGKTGL